MPESSKNIYCVHTDADINKETPRWNRAAWFRVFLCTAAIFSTVPMARSVQRYVYAAIGKEFFTYMVLLIILSLLTVLLYFFIFRLRVKSASQYAWLIVSCGAYIYTTLQLKKHPEEAVHLLEFGLLSYFFFRALSHRIRDWTVYITTALYVLFIGTIDEFIQWVTPERIWSYSDIKINALAGVFFIMAVSKGIKPEIIRGPVKRISVDMLAGIITVNLLFLGLCLSNTPDTVNRYTELFHGLSWLRQEETMSEFGHKHKAPEIGSLFSRLPIEEIKRIDTTGGHSYTSNLPEDIGSLSALRRLMKTYNPYTDKFSYEFFIHVSHRDDNFRNFMETGNAENRLRAFKENLIVEKYFNNTLKKTPYKWPEGKIEELGDTDLLRSVDYSSTVGDLITLFSLRTAWSLIITLIVSVWAYGTFWKRRLDHD